MWCIRGDMGCVAQEILIFRSASCHQTFVRLDNRFQQNSENGRWCRRASAALGQKENHHSPQIFCKISINTQWHHCYTPWFLVKKTWLDSRKSKNSNANIRKCPFTNQTKPWDPIKSGPISPQMKAAPSLVGSGEPRLPRQWGGGSRAGPAESWVFVMQTRPFPTSIKEVASVESVQLGLCDTAGLSNSPVIVRELAIHFGVSHGVLRAFGALLSKARTRWHPPPIPLHSCGCTVVFPCLLSQCVVLWSSSVSYLTGMATGPDCVGVGSNCSHIWKPPSLQSAAGTGLRIAFPCVRLENREKNHESLNVQDAGTFRGARAQKIHSKCPHARGGVQKRQG